MSHNINTSNIDRLIYDTRDNLQELDRTNNTETIKRDAQHLEHLIFAALAESNRIHSTNIEEIMDVKPLYDRIHSIIVALRVARNTLEQLEYQAELALANAKEISHAVEEPYDDHEL